MYTSEERISESLLRVEWSKSVKSKYQQQTAQNCVTLKNCKQKYIYDKKSAQYIIGEKCLKNICLKIYISTGDLYIIV